jgi:hypothetical protein
MGDDLTKGLKGKSPIFSHLFAILPLFSFDYNSHNMYICWLLLFSKSLNLTTWKLGIGNKILIGEKASF